MDIKDLKNETEHLEHTLSLNEDGEKYDPSREGPRGIDSELARYADGERIEISEEENSRLRWLVNKRVLSFMLFTYFLQSLDKGTMGFSAIMGIRTDTKLVGQEYAWLTTIFYLASTINEAPMNMLVQKLPVGKLLGGCVIAWGCVLATTAASHNFVSLMVVRFLLGWFEAAVQPCFLVMTSMWFKRSEQAETVSYWYAANGIQQAVGGLLAFGVSHIKNPNIKSWQVLFMMLGIFTVFWGAVIILFLPDSPMRAKCFSEQDRIKLVERVRSNQTGLQNKTFKRDHLIEGLTDPVLGLLFILQVLNCLTSGGAGAFGNIVIVSFGFTSLQTQLLSIAQGGVTLLTCLGPAYLARKTGQTIYVMIGLCFPMLAGSLVLMKIVPTPKNRIGLLIAFYAILSLNGIAVLLYGLLIRNIGGRTKQTTAIVVVFLGWGAGNCIGPQVFRASDSPRYPIGFAVYLSCACIQIVVLLGLRSLLMFRNARNKKLRAEKRNGDDSIRTDNAFEDLTDGKNIDFEYHY